MLCCILVQISVVTHATENCARSHVHMKKMVNNTVTLSEAVRAFDRDIHNHAEDHFSDNAVQIWRHKESRRGQPDPKGANLRVHTV